MSAVTTVARVLTEHEYAYDLGECMCGYRPAQTDLAASLPRHVARHVVGALGVEDA